jgi:2-polyprenyl-6-methoxyphenol hydroxylase-like FAD-dependent oxidoreductase
MTRDDWINYRPLAAVLQPKPWYNGRVVLLGDAVHATTPHLASGAGMAVESGIVLAEELARADSVEAGLLAYQERRYPRCQDVIDSSVSMGRLQLAHGDPREHAAILEGALSRLNEDFDDGAGALDGARLYQPHGMIHRPRRQRHIGQRGVLGRAGRHCAPSVTNRLATSWA